MNGMKQSRNRSLKIIVLAVILAVSFGFVFQANQVNAASKNKKAHKAFRKKIESIKTECISYNYKFVNVTGDSTHEMLITYYSGLHGSGTDFRIYAYKNKKAKCIHKEVSYGLSKITVYKKAKSMVLYYAGHGGETYSYLKMKNGKFKSIASKSRISENGGGEYNGPWQYSVYKGSPTKKNYKKLTKKLKKGKKKIISTNNWQGGYGDLEVDDDEDEYD